MVHQAYHRHFTGNNCKGSRFLGIVFLLLCLVLSTSPLFAGGIPQTQLQFPLGSGSALGNGDYISSNTGGLNTYFSYFIEVPPATGNLTLDIFDADIGGIGNGGAANDFNISGYNTNVRYELISP